MAKDVTVWHLIDDEYVKDFNPKKIDKLMWADIPKRYMVTEQIVRNAIGGSDPSWIELHLVWRGCKRARRWTGGLFTRCPWVAQVNELCKRHSPK